MKAYDLDYKLRGIVHEELRKRHNTIKAIAEGAELAQSTVSRHMHTRTSRPQFLTILKLCCFLNIEITFTPSDDKVVRVRDKHLNPQQVSRLQ